MKSVITSLYLIIFSLNSPSIKADDSPLLEMEKRIISVYKKNVNSVVNVSNIKVANYFFYGKVEVPQGAGSGFIWDEDGHIVTNYHVVEGGDNFVITFHNDKKQYKAKVVGVAPNKDIAVLKLIQKPKFLQPIKTGSSSKLTVGQLALAIGNPFGFDHSISRGIISALGRKMDGAGGVKIHNMIQTDAAINQGNSGGPLLNSSGELIGMNTMIVSTSQSSAGLGFAVPTNTIKRIVPDIIKYKKVIRPALGIGVLDDRIRERFIGDRGVIISYIDKNGAAAAAGLQGVTQDRRGRYYIGDVITAIDKTPINSRDDIYHALEKYKIGDTINLKIIRDEKPREIMVKLKGL